MDRLKSWDNFSQAVRHYIEHSTTEKYKINKHNEVDLMSITPAEIMIWNCLKYALRCFNGHGKDGDLFKLAHYAQLAWTELNFKGINESELCNKGNKEGGEMVEIKISTNKE